nr:hypothetical protein BaRGS_015281 [Batillaria attramentaria]
MERTESLEDLTNARQEFDRKVSEDIYSHEQNKKAFETLEEGFLHKRKETHKKTSGEDKDHGTGDEDEAQQMDILCSSLDPNNPITICLQKRNVAVLQYLLYKHVWQHFLLDDVFALPQTSQVPDLDPTRPRSPRPEVDWFLHCCSLMGCPQLLEKVLSGSFGTEIPRSHENAKRNTRKDIPATSKSDLEPGTSCGAVGQSQVGECIELREEYACTKEVTSGGSESHPTEFPVLPNTIAGVSEVSTDLPDDASPTGNDMPSRPHSAGSVRLKGDQRPKKDMTAKQGKTSTKTLKPPSTRTSVSSMKPYCPDPNTRLPVSLPVMDRWISRCMHLSCTPLHLACWRCDANSIRVLLKHGANVNAMAEELESPEEKDGDRNSGGGGHSHNSSSTASSEVSYIELAISNTAPFTLTSSSFDLPGSTSHVEYALRIETRERRGVTPLALLALGIRSPPDFSLSIGRALGLVLPALPELSPGGQIDRSSGEARLRFMEALKLLLDAGADVNAFSCIFRKAFRPLELFLQPSVDLYYAPLMPRGGRDSAVLRCMDLERVAELVLGACWELLFK